MLSSFPRWQPLRRAAWNRMPSATAIITITALALSTVLSLSSSPAYARQAVPEPKALWAREFNSSGGNGDHPAAMKQDTQGNLVVVGNSAIAKYRGSDGALMWKKAVEVSTPLLALDAAGNVFVAGTLRKSTTNYDWRTVKYRASDGATLWQQDESGLETPYIMIDRPIAIAVDSSGNAVVSGYLSSFGIEVDSWRTVKYQAGDGARLWSNEESSELSVDNTPLKMTVDPAGNVIVLGYLSIMYDRGWRAVKYGSADGNRHWVSDHMGDEYNHPETPVALTLDSAGNVIVTGMTSLFYPSEDESPFSGRGWLTMKLDGSNGGTVWSNRIEELSDNYPSALALDAEGNVIVSGQISPFGFSKWRTLKYQASDGAILWQNDEETSSGSTSLSVDTNGDVFTCRNVGNWRTTKFRGSDGYALWQKDESGSANGSAAPLLGLDQYNNLIVSGRLNNSPNSNDYNWRTVKYQFNTGTTLWKKEEYGSQTTVGTGDAPLALTFDTAGNVILAGVVNNQTTGYDWRLTKYENLGPALPFGLAIGHDGKYRMALLSPDGKTTTLVRSSSTGALETTRSKPFSLEGYQGKDVALGPDDTGYLLYGKERSAVLWTLASDFYTHKRSLTVKPAATDGDVTPRDMAVDKNGKIWIAWERASDKKILVRRYALPTALNGDLVTEASRWLIPKAGERYSGFTLGQDLKPRVFLAAENRTATPSRLWIIKPDLSAQESSWLLGVHPGLDATQLALPDSDSDLRTRLLYRQTSNGALVGMRLSPTGVLEAQWNWSAPIREAYPAGFAVRPDRYNFVLWRLQNGRIIVRKYDRNSSAMLDSDAYGPYY